MVIIKVIQFMVFVWTGRTLICHYTAANLTVILIYEILFSADKTSLYSQLKINKANSKCWSHFLNLLYVGFISLLVKHILLLV